jgi:hypothetical protein
MYRQCARIITPSWWARAWLQVEPFGSALTIPLGRRVGEAEACAVAIEYTTTAASSALQWLGPSQVCNARLCVGCTCGAE